MMGCPIAGLRPSRLLKDERKVSPMRLFQALIWPVSVITTLIGSNWADAAEASNPQLTPLLTKVLTPPHALPGSDQRTHLVYEIRIANTTSGRIRLERIAVVDSQAGTTLATLD